MNFVSNDNYYLFVWVAIFYGMHVRNLYLLSIKAILFISCVGLYTFFFLSTLRVERFDFLIVIVYTLQDRNISVMLNCCVYNSIILLGYVKI